MHNYISFHFNILPLCYKFYETKTLSIGYVLIWHLLALSVNKIGQQQWYFFKGNNSDLWNV